jgi:hypothetical protein
VPTSRVDALMLVIDTNHTMPGATGEVTIGEMAWERLELDAEPRTRTEP